MSLEAEKNSNIRKDEKNIAEAMADCALESYELSRSVMGMISPHLSSKNREALEADLHEIVESYNYYILENKVPQRDDIPISKVDLPPRMILISKNIEIALSDEIHSIYKRIDRELGWI